MRIAYFADSLPPSIDGVAQTFLQLVHTLRAQNLDYYFFSPFKPEENELWHEKVDQVNSIPLFLYTDYRISLPDQRKVFDRLYSFKPDIIHVSSPTFLGQMGQNYARKRKIPAVSSYHTHFVSYFKYYGFALFEKFGWNFVKWFYNQFDRIYVPSPSTAKELEYKGFENLELWQRGIDTKRFNPQRRNAELRRQLNAGDIPILLFVGRLVQEKDLEDLVAVDRILKKKGTPFKIVIVGDGPMRDQLQAELPDANFSGYLKGDALAEIYASADIFIFPSTTETFGNVILEAYASGLPVVGVNKGGVVDLILDGHTGFIAVAKDAEDIASKVELLINYPQLRLKYVQNALRFVNHFSWTEINKKLILSYEQLLTRNMHSKKN